MEEFKLHYTLQIWQKHCLCEPCFSPKHQLWTSWSNPF